MFFERAGVLRPRPLSPPEGARGNSVGWSRSPQTDLGLRPALSNLARSARASRPASPGWLRLLSRPLAPYPALLTLPGGSAPLPLYNGGARCSGMSRAIGLADRYRVSRRYTDKTGQKQERAEWHQVVAFGKVAGPYYEYLRKTLGGRRGDR